MRTKLLLTSIAISIANPTFATDDIDLLKQQLESLKQGYQDYEQRIQALEDRLQKAEDASVKAAQVRPVEAPRTASSSQNSFNPAISLVLDGRYASFSREPEKYELPGFALGGESGLGKEGISLGHTELTASANIDDKFYGQTTLAIHEHDGNTELELEEAFVQTLGLGNGNAC